MTAAIDSGDESSLHRTRWRGESILNGFAQAFDRPVLHDAIRKLKKVADKYGLTLAEVSLRWLMHHSVLGDGDAIIFGAKTLDQLERNVLETRKGPLEGEVLAAVEGLWGDITKADTTDTGNKNGE